MLICWPVPNMQLFRYPIGPVIVTLVMVGVLQFVLAVRERSTNV